MASSSRVPAMNALVEAMSETDRRMVLASAGRVSVSQFDVLQRTKEPIQAAYFPESGWVSFVAVMEGGRTAEVGVIGRESAVGLELMLGGQQSSFDWIVQGPGDLLRIEAAAFMRIAEQSPAIRKLLSGSALKFHDQVAQTAACNISHTVDQRLARWLLMSHDRSQSDTLPYTQDLLSMMLGARRAGVSVAAAMLKATGCIAYSRGTITILDRAALERKSCECFRAVIQRHEAMP